ncbi:MAG: Ig-like domain-containing protein [Bacteroidota bacterium]
MAQYNAPSVTITAPISGNVLDAGKDVEFTVEVLDADGDITKVEYYKGEEVIGISSISPFSFTWQNAPIGLHELTAHVYDAAGHKSTSEKVTISIAINVPPTVNIINPVVQSVIQEGEDFEILVSASDSDGEIDKVVFYANGDLLGEDTTEPYQFNWINPNTGTYEINAKAIDNKGGSSSSQSISLKVNENPQVVIINPEVGSSSLPGASISISATANDNDGKVEKVVFMVNGNEIGESFSSPFTIDWNKPDAGIYELQVFALDNDGGKAEGEMVEIFVREPYAVQITTLTQDTIVTPQAIIPIVSEPVAGYEVTKVEFYVNENLASEDDAYPFEMDLVVGDAGTYQVYVKAFYEYSKSFESNVVTVSVDQVLSTAGMSIDEIDIQIYPNPTTDFTRISYQLNKSNDVGIALADLTGKIYYSQSISGNIGENIHQVNLNNLSSGIYLLRIETGQKRYIEKIIKQ